MLNLIRNPAKSYKGADSSLRENRVPTTAETVSLEKAVIRMSGTENLEPLAVRFSRAADLAY
jgi:hypothetical protein